jgi:hypothetical protein
MPALFTPRANVIFRLVLLALGSLAAAAIAAPMIYVRTPWNTGEQMAVDQPIQFDHRHHVLDDEIDCLYCHTDAERSPHAGVPATSVCMGCHSQIWNESPLLETVRRSYFSRQPIPWNRVTDLADFVYFDHSVHVRGGVDCADCHGDVASMARVAKPHAFTMQFCLDCHRDPTGVAGVRAPAERSSMHLAASRPIGGDERRITQLTTCSACHR